MKIKWFGLLFSFILLTGCAGGYSVLQEGEKGEGPPVAPSPWKLQSGVVTPVNPSWSVSIPGTASTGDITSTGDVTAVDGTFSGAVAIGTTGVNPARMTSKIAMTNGDTQTAITAAQVLANYYVSNQGDTVETDVILPAVSYPISVLVVVEEATIIEVCPPTGELFDLDGTALDANDCVDSPAVVGSKAVFTRMQIADGSWRWSVDTVRGTWVDTGATD